MSLRTKYIMSTERKGKEEGGKGKEWREGEEEGER